MIIFPLLLLLFAPDSRSQDSEESKEWSLWYQQPATDWNEALPIGNGRLGAMAFGNPERELFQLNEESLWAGSQMNNNNPAALKNLPIFRDAIFKGDFRTASEIAARDLLGTPPRIRSYEPLGDLEIKYNWQGKPENYKRELSLNKAVSIVTFDVNRIRFIERAWISAPDNVMVVDITSPDGGKIDIEVMLKREKGAVINYSSGGKIEMMGQINDKEDSLSGPGGAHMSFAGLADVRKRDGEMWATDSSLRIKAATHVTIIFTAATDYDITRLNFDKRIKPLNTCTEIISRLSNKTADEIYQKHLTEFTPKFERVNLSFGTELQNNLPTDIRLKKVQDGEVDNSLVVLYFQYGRYLLLNSSRYPGVLPANLQGIWNKDFNAAWNADFHTNINLQMNYWAAESAGLPETVGPLSDFMTQLMKPGSVTAKEMYGTRGWTMHHLTDPFGRTGVADGPWGITPMDGPWMTLSIFRHFLYTGDTSFLRNTAYPLLKGSVEFLCDFLVQSPDGYLVTNPSHSPENSYYDPVTHEKQTLTYGATTDIEIAHAVFDYFIHAAAFLRADENLVRKVKAVQEKLPPIQISKEGRIQEWIKDFEEVEPGHRHMSHLLGLYPFGQFTPRTPELFNAARNSLERRLKYGGGHTGWSRAWIISLYARLLDSEMAYQNVMELLRKNTFMNLFDFHPPFQIDGNFGGVAGIIEMLLQCNDGKINLLPALPGEWQAGSFSGLRAIGGFTLNVSWENGRPEKIEIFSALGGNCRISSPVPLVSEKNGILIKASGKNPNPFYAAYSGLRFVRHGTVENENTDGRKQYIYDLVTQKGKSYVLLNED